MYSSEKLNVFKNFAFAFTSESHFIFPYALHLLRLPSPHPFFNHLKDASLACAAVGYPSVHVA